MKGRIDGVLDEPRQRHAGKVRGDQGKNPKNQETAIAINEKLDAVVMTKNLGFLLLVVPTRIIHRQAMQRCSGFKVSVSDLEH